MNSGKRIVLSSVAGLALGTFGCIAAVSAQTPAPGSPGQPAPRQDERTPAARAAENYDPLGVPVGSFRLFPELELDDIREALRFAAEAIRERELPLLSRSS